MMALNGRIPQKGSDRPEIKYVYMHVRDPVAEKWENVGMELLAKKDKTKLNVIKMNNAGNNNECCGEMLELWLRRQPKATWKQLLTTLRAPCVELHDVASAIEGMLLPSNPAAKDDDGDAEINEFNVLQYHYAKLRNTMTDIDDLLMYFVEEKIITINQEDEIKRLPTKSEKVQKLVLNISGPLKAGYTDGFYTMLKVMKEHGIASTQQLAKDIKLSIVDNVGKQPKDSSSSQSDMQFFSFIPTFSKDEDIEDSFIKLSSFVTTVISETNFSTLKKAAIEKARSQRFPKSHEVLPIISAAESYDALCLKLAQTSYWNFLDTRMLEAMGTSSMVPAAQYAIENYKKAFFSLTLEEAAPYFPVSVHNKPGHIAIEEILDEDPKKMTIGKLHRHRFYLETEIFQTGSDTCTICKVVIGSVIITWQIHAEYAYQAYLSLNKKRSQLPQTISYLSIREVARWIGQPIPWRGGQKIQQIGPIEALIDVKQEPVLLPEGYVWANLTFNDIDEILSLYADDEKKPIKKNLIKWSTSHPQFKSNLLFGIRKSSNKELVFAVFCIPYCICVGGKLLPVVQLRYCGIDCEDHQAETDLLHNIAFREMMRRVKITEVSQATLISESPMVIRPVVIVSVWCYALSDRPLPYSTPRTVGLRKMIPADIPKALALVNQHMSQYEIGQVFQTKEEFSHYFCPSISGRIIASYVVEDPITTDLTDMFALRSANVGEIRGGAVTAIVPTKTPVKQFIVDLLLCAKHEGFKYIVTSQYGLSKDYFVDLFELAEWYNYWHIYNYNYPEVDEENFCIVMHT